MNLIRAQAIGIFRKILIFFVLLSFMSPPLVAMTRVEMISSIDFVAEVLEMVKFNLKTARSDNLILIFQPWVKNSSIKIDERTDFILLQDGISKSNVNKDFVKTSQKIELVWLLLVKVELFRRLKADEINLLSFADALETDYCKTNYKYPWFESLYSKSTLLNFIKVLGKPKSRGMNKKKSFARQDGAIKTLYRAIEDGVLNPLSLEASKQLALNVFRANDSACCTLWVPYDLLVSDSNSYNNIVRDFEVIAFPRLDGKCVIPKMSFSLWKRKTSKAELKVKQIIKNNKNLDCQFIENDFKKNMKWFEEKFSQAYDRLIMGDF